MARTSKPAERLPRLASTITPLKSTTPLLSPTESYDSSDEDGDTPFLSSQLSRSKSRSSSFIRIEPTHNPKLIIAILYIIVFILAFGAGLMGVPCLRIWEQIVCHYHYDKLEGDAHIGYEEEIDEGMCKGTEVQERLNLLIAGLWFIGNIPCEFLSKCLSGLYGYCA